MAASSSSNSTNYKRNFYEILNATSASTFAELKANYKQLILKFHPDKLQQQQTVQQQQQQKANSNNQQNKKDGDGDDDDGSSGDGNTQLVNNSYRQFTDLADEKEFLAINEAWNCLKDPRKRKQYDMEQLMQSFQLHDNIYARVNFANLDWFYDSSDVDEMEAILYCSYGCRCGGEYSATEAQLKQWLEENHIDLKAFQKKNEPSGATTTTTTTSSKAAGVDSSDNKCDADTTKTNDLIIECNQCSLAISVYFVVPPYLK